MTLSLLDYNITIRPIYFLKFESLFIDFLLLFDEKCVIYSFVSI